MTTTAAATTITCVECGRTWTCDPAGACWCKDLSLRLPMPAPTAAPASAPASALASGGTACLCPCKMAALAEGRKPEQPS